LRIQFLVHDTFFSDGKSIRIEAHQPASTAVSGRPAVVLLHDAGGNVGFWLDRLAPHLLSAGFSLYAPLLRRHLHNYPELATIADGVHFPQWLDTVGAALNWVADRPGTDPRRIALIGISLGGFLALSFAARNSASSDEPVLNTVRCIVDLSGGLTNPTCILRAATFHPRSSCMAKPTPSCRSPTRTIPPACSRS
jgi:dienelactone hydrolase